MMNPRMQAFVAKESECVQEMGDFGKGEDVLVQPISRNLEHALFTCQECR
jgi:hypothetical protein